MNRLFVQILLSFVVCSLVYGQENFNVQKLTPSALLPNGTWEIKVFNSNYTQSKFFNADGQKVDASGGTLYNVDGSERSNVDIVRNTFFTSVNQINYGLNSSVNIGLEVWVSAGAISEESDSRFGPSIFEQTANSRAGLSYIGARVKFVPISSVSNFSVQSIFLVPVAKDLESHQQFPRPFINWDNYTWINQFFLDVPLNDHWLLFLNVDMVWGLSRNKLVNELRGNRFTIPVKTFVNYFATPKLTILLQSEYNRIWQAFGDQEIRKAQGAFYYQLGPSVKYQLIPGKLEGEIGYNYFLAGNNGQGAGNSLNLGIRILL
jgi:hypothetical protein